MARIPSSRLWYIGKAPVAQARRTRPILTATRSEGAPCPTPSSSFPLPARPSAACWATPPTWPPGNWRRGHQGRGGTRRRAWRRRRRGADGNCLMAGQGQAPARQATLLKAGLPSAGGAVTLSKMCGSGMRAMMFAHDMLTAGSVERDGGRRHGEMTNAPHLMLRAQGINNGASADLRPWRWTAWKTPTSAARPLGVFAEACAWPSTPSRARRDQFAIASTTRQDGQRGRQLRLGRWRRRCRQGGRHGDQVGRAAVQGQARQDPGPEAAFKKDGAITAATPVEHSDGAAALVLMRESTARQDGRRRWWRASSRHGARPGAGLEPDYRAGGAATRRCPEEKPAGTPGAWPVGG